MKLKSHDNIVKPKGKKRLINSFKYAFQGFSYAIKNEQNLCIHIIMSILVIILGLLLNLEKYEWLFLILITGLVIATELINTAIEANVDLVCQKFDINAKIAKDTAAAGVFVFALTAIIGGIFIFVPKLIALL